MAMGFCLVDWERFGRDVFKSTTADSVRVYGGQRYHRRGLGLRVYADRIGVSHATLARVVKGRPCDALTYARCCRFMGCSLDYYVKG